MFLLRIQAASLTIMLCASRALAQGYSPDEAVVRMQVPPGFEVQLVASEPLVRQPVAIEFDDQGRLWVVQYLQYPNPEGLARVRVDRYSRTVYDRVPPPPPAGPRGADRITILEDADGDGRADRSHDFVDGLNLASGLAMGYGGVFVMNPPYLLFYRDENRDDVPDGDPEVLLSGFGMEDAHSVANSLTWGPDGWLYGTQGSTVTARVLGVEFQQGVWRYHPVSRQFELFCEGGGNAWGLDFDSNGELLYSTNVGGYHLAHGVQGGYYWKSFGKHGALHNPYAFGYFDHVPHANFRGGHVTVGGIVYQHDALGDAFRGKVIAADLLGHAVYWHELEVQGSSFRSRHGGELLLANDTWFAPTDLVQGPEGAIYVADWHDERTAHPDPDAQWDRTNGRIYRIARRDMPRPQPPDFQAAGGDELIRLAGHSNEWIARRARRVLAQRRDPAAIERLRRHLLAQQAASDEEPIAELQALWTLAACGAFDNELAEKLIASPHPAVRQWVVRLVGDHGEPLGAMAQRLTALAALESEPAVISQLACSARRVGASSGLAIARELAFRDELARDPRLPLLLWWAVEPWALSHRENVLELFASATAWQRSMVRDAILGRLMRRYAADASQEGLRACTRLLSTAPDAQAERLLLEGLDQGYRPQPLVAEFTEAIVTRWRMSPDDRLLLRLSVRLGAPEALARAIEQMADGWAPQHERLAMLTMVGDAGHAECGRQVLKLIGQGEPEAIELAAVDAFERLANDELALELVDRYADLAGSVRSRARDFFFRRRSAALAFLQAVDQGRYAADEVTLAQLAQVSAHGDAALDALVRKHWGAVRQATPEEMLAEVRRLHNDLRAAAGDSQRGRALFRQHCGNCHKLFGEGQAAGPELTHANRHDRDFLLVSLVDPSAVIRKEYLSQVVRTTDGRLLTGLVIDSTPQELTLAVSADERVSIVRSSIAEAQESGLSIMPAELYKQLRPQDLRDLFSYLESEPPAATDSP